MTTPQTRNIILTGAVAAITATGAWYGAGLKTRQEFKHEKQSLLESTLDDKISQLELTRERYVKQRDELQAKIERLADGKGVGGGDGRIVPGR